MKENIFLAAAAVAGIGLCLYGIRQNQLGPHRVNHYIASRLCDSVVVTNPAYLTFEWEWELTNGVAVPVAHKRTNYYWRVWGIFK